MRKRLLISTHDRKTNLLHFRYLIEKGETTVRRIAALSDKGFGGHVMRTRQPLMVNEDLPARAAEVGSWIVGGGEMCQIGHLGAPGHR